MIYSEHLTTNLEDWGISKIDLQEIFIRTFLKTNVTYPCNTLSITMTTFMRIENVTSTKQKNKLFDQNWIC